MLQKTELQSICFIVNYNLYESKRYFTHHLADSLAKLGVRIKIVDVQEGPLSSEALKEMIDFRPDLTCSFNTLLPISEDRYLGDVLHIPHLSILLDPAIYSTALTRSPFSILSCVDRDDCHLLETSGFPRVFFFPHAVEKSLIGSGKHEKTHEVVFLGSCYDYESLRVSWRQQNPENINQVLDDAIDIVFSDNRTSLAEALTKAWSATGRSPEGVDFPALFYYLDNYTRGRDRVELIRAIKDAPVHVYGALSSDNAVGVLGWSPYLAGNKNVTVHPQVSFTESMHILQHSKIALNSMPFFKNGSHERVLTALAAGALPVTTDTVFFRENFKENEEIVFYQPKKWENVNALIHRYLEDEGLRQEVVARGSLIVEQKFTWDCRAKEMLQSLSSLFKPREESGGG